MGAYRRFEIFAVGKQILIKLQKSVTDRFCHDSASSIGCASYRQSGFGSDRLSQLTGRMFFPGLWVLGDRRCLTDRSRCALAPGSVWGGGGGGGGGMIHLRPVGPDELWGVGGGGGGVGQHREDHNHHFFALKA